MAANEIHINNVGTVFRVTISEDGSGVDISSTTSRLIRFGKPDGTTVEKTGTLVDGGTSGIMSYTAESGFLDACGTWKIQGFVDFGDDEHYSDINKFKVYTNL